MHFLIFFTGAAILVWNVIYAASFSTERYVRIMEKAKVQGMPRQQIPGRVAYVVLGGAFIGAFWYADFRWVWLIVGAIAVLCSTANLLMLLKMQSANDLPPLDDLSREEMVKGARGIQIKGTPWFLGWSFFWAYSWKDLILQSSV